MVRRLLKFIKMVILILFLISAMIAILFVYAFKVEPYRLRTESLTLQTGFSESFNVVQISDIQISESFTIENLNRVVQKINEQIPDVVLFTGDLYEVYADYHDDAALINTLSGIKAKYGKFAIWGNRDYGGGAESKYERIMEQSGFRLLRNEPDVADKYADQGFDLIVSGHSHGGQVNVPFLPRMTTALAEKYVDGLYQLNDQTSLYVNSGIGTSRYPIRFGVIPQITVFSLE